MDKNFYREIAEMSEEALQELNHYESTGITGDVFDKIRAVGTPCLDGDKINASIKSDLPIRDHLKFQRAIFSVVKLSTLSGGVGKNQEIRLSLETIKNTFRALVANTTIKSPQTVFYSWQSSLPNKTNRGLIKDCLEKALKEINRDLSIESRVSLDSDTSNTPGSPDIIHTILKKIDTSSIFIADVSIVNMEQPNSNVMFELGYAMKVLGDANIVMVFNDSYGATKDLPFDLGFKRQMIYSCSEIEEDMSQIRKLLVQKLKSAIEVILFPSDSR